jgi:hypothetical protein
MTDTVTCYFRNAAGEVHEVTLPALEAVHACNRHPVEWSFTPLGFAPANEGFVPSEGDGGGRGRIRGASVRVD